MKQSESRNIVNVTHPELTAEERAKRMKEIERAAAKLYANYCTKVEKTKADQARAAD